MPIWLIMALAGAGKDILGQDKENRENRAAADQTRYSYLTHFGPGQIKQADPLEDAIAMGGQGALMGMMNKGATPATTGVGDAAASDAANAKVSAMQSGANDSMDSFMAPKATNRRYSPWQLMSEAK